MAKIAIRQSKNGAAKRTTATTGNPILDETAEIQKIAYQLFVDRGYEHGHDQEDWTRAEKLYRSRKRF